jgi:hypothetical protein
MLKKALRFVAGLPGEQDFGDINRPPSLRYGAASFTQLRFVKDGGAKEGRTPDLLNAIQTLYQLSYDPIPETDD